MKLTKENISVCPIREEDRELVCSILSDMTELNEEYGTDFYIDIQCHHDDCSPEWVDPCPDYYGYYTFRSVKEPYEILGTEMTLEDLDNEMVLFYDLVGYLKK